MSYDVINDDMSYWAHGPCAHQVSLRYLEKWARYDHFLTTTTTTSIIIIIIIIIIAKMKPHKNKIPFPYRGNGITRGTVQGAQWIPFLTFGFGKKTGNNNENVRRKWISWKSSHVTQLHNTSCEAMAPLERASMTSYSTLLVTMALSASVSKLQPFEICLTSIWPLKVTQGQSQWPHLQEHVWLPIQL